MPSSPRLFLGTYSSLAETLAERIFQERQERGERTLTQWLARPIEVIVPSGGVMRSIETALLRIFRGPLAGVELRTPESFARALIERRGELLRIAPDLLQELAMDAAALRRLEPELHSPGIAGMLRRSYRDLRDGGMTLDEATPRLRRAGLIVPAAEVWKEYEAILSKSGTVDPADLLVRAIHAIPKSPPATQIVFGFYDATRMQEGLFEALANADRLDSVWVPVHPSEETFFAGRFLDNIRQHTREETIVGRKEPVDFSIEQMSNPRTEAKEICRRIRKMLEDGADPRSIAIVVRRIDQVEATLFDRAAEEFGFEIERGRERPLAATRIGRAVLLLESLGDRRFPRAAMVELLRTGIRLTDSRPGAEWIDRVSRKLHIGGGTSDYVAQATSHLELKEGERDAVRMYVDALRQAEELLSRWPKRQSGASWADAIEAVTSRFTPHDTFDVDALTTFDGLGDSLRLIGDRDIDRTAVVDIIRSAGVKSEDRPQPLSILFTDLMQLRGASFDHLFAARMQSERFPQRRSDDVILTPPLREALGLRQIGDGLDEERLLFELLTDSTRRKMHFTFSRSDAAGKPDLASSFLKAFATRRFPDEKMAIYRDFSLWIKEREVPPAHALSRSERTAEEIIRLPIQMNARIHRALAIEGSIHASRFDGGMFDALDVVREEIAKKLEAGLSPTSFEVLAVCPHRFLLQTVLEIQDVEDPELEVDIERRERGTVDHLVLERLFSDIDEQLLQASIDGEAAAVATIESRLDQHLDATYDDLDRKSPPLLRNARQMQREISRTQLKRFLQHELEELRTSGWRPWRTELAFGPSSRHEAEYPAAELQAGGENFRLRGKIDRVDKRRNEEPGIRIVDYKSGTAFHYKNLQKKIRDGEHIQLPLYAMAVASLLDVDPGSVTGEIKPLRVSSATRPMTFRFEEVEEDVMRTLQGGLATLAGARYRAIATSDCDYCSVANWCRERHANPFEEESPFT